MKPSKIITIPISKEEVTEQNPAERMPVEQITQQMTMENQNMEPQELGKLNHPAAALAHPQIQQDYRGKSQGGSGTAENLRGSEAGKAGAADQQILEQTHQIRQQEATTVKFAYQQHDDFNSRVLQPQSIVHQAATVSIPLLHPIQPPSLSQSHLPQPLQSNIPPIQPAREQPQFLSPN